MEAITTVDVVVNHMHGTHPHPPRTTNRDPPRPSGDEATAAAAATGGAPGRIEADGSPRDGVDDETDARTTTHRDPGRDDAHSDATAATPIRPVEVTAS